jgi:hypothetical protein
MTVQQPLSSVLAVQPDRRFSTETLFLLNSYALEIQRLAKEASTVLEQIVALQTGLTEAQEDIAAAEGKLVAPGGTTGQVLAKASPADFDLVWADSADPALSGMGSITLPNNALSGSATFAAPGVLPGARVLVGLGPFTDADENAVELLEVAALGAVAGTDEITATIALRTPGAGEIKLTWSATNG